MSPIAAPGPSPTTVNRFSIEVAEVMARVYAPDLYPTKKPAYAVKADPFLKQWPGIDPDILAYTLGISVHLVLARQRALGLRKCKYAARKGNSN